MTFFGSLRQGQVWLSLVTRGPGSWQVVVADDMNTRSRRRRRLRLPGRSWWPVSGLNCAESLLPGLSTVSLQTFHLLLISVSTGILRIRAQSIIDIISAVSSCILPIQLVIRMTQRPKQKLKIYGHFCFEILDKYFMILYDYSNDHSNVTLSNLSYLQLAATSPLCRRNKKWSSEVMEYHSDFMYNYQSDTLHRILVIYMCTRPACLMGIFLCVLKNYDQCKRSNDLRHMH